MKKKILRVASGVLILAGFLCLLSVAGGSDLGVIGFGQIVIRGLASVAITAVGFLLALAGVEK